MGEGRWHISVTAPDWGQDHLSPEAVVAFVDGELAPGPRTRAAGHLGACLECASQVMAQGQARSALRTAGCPSLPSALLSTLRSIPHSADLPAPPTGLAMTADGQLVSVLRPDRVGPRRGRTGIVRAAAPDRPTDPVAGPDAGPGAVADRSGPSGRHDPSERIDPSERHDPSEHGRRVLAQRRRRFGTGVAVSGLALGALAFGVPAPSLAAPTPAPPLDRGVLGGPALGGSPSVVDAQLRLSPVSRAPVSSPPRPFSTGPPWIVPTWTAPPVPVEADRWPQPTGPEHPGLR